MGYFKNLDLEIRELEFGGASLQAIADRVGLSVPQVSAILDQIVEDVYNCTEFSQYGC